MYYNILYYNIVYYNIVYYNIFIYLHGHCFLKYFHLLTSIVYKNIFIYLQTLFILFVNSQGIFIFSFHCARNGEIRAGWLRLWRDVTGDHRISPADTQISHVRSGDTAASMITKTRISYGDVAVTNGSDIKPTPVN